jgi:hypothetical protein
MAIHAVVVAMCATSKRQRLVFYPLLGSTFVYFILGTIVGTRTHESQYYLRPTGVNSFRQFWSWIGNGSCHNAECLAGEYTWMWVGFSVSAMICVPLYLVDRGAPRVSQTWWTTIELQGHGHAQVEGQTRRSINIIVYVGSDFSESTCRLTFFLH